VTILSLNKTREEGRIASVFVFMKKNIRYMTHGAVIAALYVALSFLQNMLLPGSASQAIQFRVSEALCVLALFTPAAIPGLTLGCLIFNVAAGASPVDFIVGSAASALAAVGMYLTRNLKLRGYPALAMVLPAICNGALVGLMLTYYYGGGFWFNCGCVAIGELGVLLTLGTGLYYSLKKMKDVF